MRSFHQKRLFAITGCSNSRLALSTLIALAQWVRTTRAAQSLDLLYRRANVLMHQDIGYSLLQAPMNTAVKPSKHLKAIGAAALASTCSLLLTTSAAASSLEETLLEAHNQYRSEVGVAPLTWSDTVAASAQAWADRLAAANALEHSSSSYGENLWKGTAGAYSAVDMVGSWGDEQQFFIPNAAFPNLSTTGSWFDVGHYTQIVWADTTQVGCGLATGNGWDVLVCQYDPPGNFSGQEPF